MGVDVGFFGDVADGGTKSGQVGKDVAAMEEDAAAAGLEQAGEDLDRGGFAGAVGAEIADDLAGMDGEGDVFDGGQAAVAFGDVLELEYGAVLLHSAPYVGNYCQAAQRYSSSSALHR